MKVPKAIFLFMVVMEMLKYTRTQVLPSCIVQVTSSVWLTNYELL